MKKIYCTECSGEIISKEDLVTTTALVSVVPYHTDCYSTALKGCQTVFVGNYPINGISGTFSAVLSVIIAVAVLLINGVGSWFLAVQSPCC